MAGEIAQRLEHMLCIQEATIQSPEPPGSQNSLLSNPCAYPGIAQKITMNQGSLPPIATINMEYVYVLVFVPDYIKFQRQFLL